MLVPGNRTHLARRLVRITLLGMAMALAGCVYSYTLPRAILHIDLPASGQSPAEMSVVRGIVGHLGFERVKEQASAGPSADFATCATFGRACDFSLTEPDMILWIVDYTDLTVMRRYVDYAPTDAGVIEVNVYRRRAEGFDQDGLRVYASLKSALETAFPGRVHEIRAPPLVGGGSYAAQLTELLLSGLVIFGLPVLAATWVFYRLLARTGWERRWKRAIFVAASSAALSPMPAPAAILFVTLVPNAVLLLAPSIGWYSRIWSFALPSFAITAGLGALVSLRLFR